MGLVLYILIQFAKIQTKPLRPAYSGRKHFVILKRNKNQVFNSWFHTKKGIIRHLKLQQMAKNLPHDGIKRQPHDNVIQLGKTKWRRVKSKFLEQNPDNTCVYCGTPDLKVKASNPKNKLTVDHIFPISKGGSVYDFKNMVVACETCNVFKSNSIIRVAS